MSMYFYGDSLDIGVDNPGYGEMLLVADSEFEDTARPWERLLVGWEIGRFLTQLTTLALTGRSPDPGTALLPRGMTQAQAAETLPRAQEAVVLAVAGMERTERTYQEFLKPEAPICVNCSQGSVHAGYEAVSAWCTRHGHTPFGWPAGTTWQDALDRYEVRLARWERARELEARP